MRCTDLQRHFLFLHPLYPLWVDASVMLYCYFSRFGNYKSSFTYFLGSIYLKSYANLNYWFEQTNILEMARVFLPDRRENNYGISLYISRKVVFKSEIQYVFYFSCNHVFFISRQFFSFPFYIS